MGQRAGYTAGMNKITAAALAALVALAVCFGGETAAPPRMVALPQAAPVVAAA